MAYTIVLDAGHGGSDPGAVYQGRQEKDDNLRLALAVGDILSRNGIDVVYTRTEDVYQTPFEKATIGNNNGADYFISFHRNSSAVPGQYDGVETLVYDKSGIKYEMAENIDGALAGLGFKNLGVKERPGLVVLRRTQMPALLVEAGFLNNSGDNKLFDERFDGIARAIAAAILGTLDMETDMGAGMTNSMNTGMDNGMNAGMNSRMNIGMNNEMNTEASGRMNDGMNPGTSNGMGAQGGGNWSNQPDWQEDPINPGERLYRVQVGAFKNKEYADKLVYELEDKGFPAFLLYEDGVYKVQVGAYRQLGNVIKQEQRLRRAGYSTWITT